MEIVGGAVKAAHDFILYWSEKLVIALFPAGYFALTNDHRGLIAIIAWLIIIDTFLGVRVAIKHKKFSSTKLARGIHKVVYYSLALIISLIVDNINRIEPISNIPILPDIFCYWFFYIGALIVVIEATSNFEKLALLGFPVPAKALAKINKDFDLYYYKKSKKAKKRILNKE